jgi:hypothetical protein
MGRFLLEVIFSNMLPISYNHQCFFARTGSQILALLHRTVCHHSIMVLPECKSTHRVTLLRVYGIFSPRSAR